MGHKDLKRIIDVNINRATEALRALEEIARFYLNDAKMSEALKNMRHFLCNFFDGEYSVFQCDVPAAEGALGTGPV